jgi:MerR family transcriptional regulator, light-induced transcriptional regulator
LTNHEVHDTLLLLKKQVCTPRQDAMSEVGEMQFGPETDGVPVYNIKAVVEATGLPAATLRAWERRYGALSPSRTAGGYRLYSAQDVATLRWLKARVDEGLSISQAIILLSQRRRAESAPVLERRIEPLRGPTDARESLVRALSAFNETEADRILEEAFAVYGLEMVTEHIVGPAVAVMGDLWHQGRASTAVEHFASNYLRRKLDAVINAAPQVRAGPLVVLGCAPGDWHELGLLLIHLMLRRRGVNTIYLGQNVPVDQFVEEMARLRPALVVVAATTAETVSGLVSLAHAVEQMPHPHPLFGYGGRAFNVHPQLRQEVPGIFLGESGRSAVAYILELLAAPASLN